MPNLAMARRDSPVGLLALVLRCPPSSRCGSTNVYTPGPSSSHSARSFLLQSSATRREVIRVQTGNYPRQSFACTSDTPRTKKGTSDQERGSARIGRSSTRVTLVDALLVEDLSRHTGSSTHSGRNNLCPDKSFCISRIKRTRYVLH